MKSSFWHNPLFDNFCAPCALTRTAGAMKSTARWLTLGLLALGTIAIVMWWLKSSPAHATQLADNCRGVVVTALDTWKARKVPAGKQATVSGIQFHDDDWK